MNGNACEACGVGYGGSEIQSSASQYIQRPRRAGDRIAVDVYERAGSTGFSLTSARSSEMGLAPSQAWTWKQPLCVGGRSTAFDGSLRRQAEQTTLRRHVRLLCFPRRRRIQYASEFLTHNIVLALASLSNVQMSNYGSVPKNLDMEPTSCTGFRDLSSSGQPRRSRS